MLICRSIYIFYYLKMGLSWPQFSPEAKMVRAHSEDSDWRVFASQAALVRPTTPIGIVQSSAHYYIICGSASDAKHSKSNTSMKKKRSVVFAI